MGGNELEVLEYYDRKIKKYTEINNSNDVLLKCLDKLDQVKVNIDLLQKTGIGRTVSALKKKFGDDDIGRQSRDLVNKWKNVVAKEEKEDDCEEEETVVKQETVSSAYVPTPITPSYVPTPIQQLIKQEKDADEENSDKGIEEIVSKSVGPDEKEEREHHKSKKKKSHREKESERESSSKSHKKDSKEREKSHKHSSSDKEKEDRNVEKSKSNCDKSSKSGDVTRSDKSRDHKSSRHSKESSEVSSRHSKESSSSRSNHESRSDKSEKNRTKEKENVKVKQEPGTSSPVDSQSKYLNGEVKVKKEPGTEKVKVKSEQGLASFDFMGAGSNHSSSSRSKDHKKDKEKEKDKSRKREDRSDSKKSKHRDKDESSSKSSNGESKGERKRHLEEEEGYEPVPKKSRDMVDFPLLSPPGYTPTPIASHKPAPLPLNIIPDISPVYKPLPREPVPPPQAPPRKNGTAEDDEASLSMVLANKNKKREAMWSGTKRRGFFGDVPRLFDQCIQVLKEHVDEIDEVGSLPFDILEPVLIQACPKTLMHIEDCNPYLMEDTAELWEKFVKKTFRNKQREEMESWREMYERCEIEREAKLDQLKGRVKQIYKDEDQKHLKTKMAYVDVAPKAPMRVRNAQVKHGTALPVGHSLTAGGPRPRNQLGDPTAGAVRAGLSMAARVPRKAPLMSKTMKLMKSLYKR